MSASGKCKALKQECILLNVAELPRITSALTLPELKDECKVRGLKGYSSLSKEPLLNLLALNSIALSRTKEYRIVELIKAQMILESNDRNAKEKEERLKQLQIQSAGTNVNGQNNPLNLEAPKLDATFSTPYHFCHLHDNVGRYFRGVPRVSTAVCDVCRGHNPKYCCEACDWDICISCFNNPGQLSTEVGHKRAMTTVNKDQPAAKVANQNKLGSWDQDNSDKEVDQTNALFQRAKDQYAREDQIFFNQLTPGGVPAHHYLQQKSQDDEYESDEDSVDTVYPNTITKPNKINTNKKKLLKYVVWTSDGYPPDGWHSYDGPPPKEFDSSFKTVAEANQRVRYKMLHDNVWGLSRSEMLQKDISETTEKKTKLLTMSVCPDDSSEFTVSAVTKEVFSYLSSGAGGDDDEDDEGYYSDGFHTAY
jgi:hypothetical protein